MQQFFITFLVSHEWKYRYPVIDLKGKTQHWIIYENHIIKRPVSNDSQVFKEAELSLHTLVPIESILDQVSIRVNVV